jgi:hypothetical protein
MLVVVLALARSATCVHDHPLMKATITWNLALHPNNASADQMQSLKLTFDDSPGAVPGGLGKWAARQVSSSSSNTRQHLSRINHECPLLPAASLTSANLYA